MTLINIVGFFFLPLYKTLQLHVYFPYTFLPPFYPTIYNIDGWTSRSAYWFINFKDFKGKFISLFHTNSLMPANKKATFSTQAKKSPYIFFLWPVRTPEWRFLFTSQYNVLKTGALCSVLKRNNFKFCYNKVIIRVDIGEMSAFKAP